MLRAATTLVTAAMLLTVGCAQPTDAPEPQASVLTLTDGWLLQSAAAVTENGATLSGSRFDASSWFPASAPTTVMAALVDNGKYPDLYLGTNLEAVDEELFNGPWWYRTEIVLTGEQYSRHARIAFDGINYSANVWLNGTQIGAEEEILGAFRTHVIDVTGALHEGVNVLAVEVSPPQPGDFTIGFVDWNPKPPDRNMGLWRPVRLLLTNDVDLSNVVVTSHLDLETLDNVELDIAATATNHTDQTVWADVHARIIDGTDKRNFAREVALAPHEQMQVRFTAADTPELVIENPRLWWPHTLGEPHLYELQIDAAVNGRVSDHTKTTFGIRHVGTYLNEAGHRGFTVNGHEVLIRGGGWVDDLLLADTPEKIEAQLAYVKHLGLNTIRLEGFWGSSHTLYDIADREGILVMPGWSCQWEWKEYLGAPVDELYGGVLEPDAMDLVAASLKDQVFYLRNHPSIFTWVLASDLLPHPDLERRYVTVLQETDRSRPSLVSCGWYDSEVSGPSGVKMSGPYDWVPPDYWYVDESNGGAFGFNTETGPGPQPPPLASLERMIPEDHLWPVDEVWDFHCGRNEFNSIERYARALDQRYGESASVDEFLRKAQAASYEAIRPMFEAFAVRRPLATGVIQWMLNSAWPEMFWQLYDHDLMPNGAFYGTLAACRSVSLAYDYGERAVYGVNDSLSAQTRLVARIRILDLQSRVTLDETVHVDLEAGSSASVLSLADLKPPSAVWFLDLVLTDSSGTDLARNFYWLPATTDRLDFEASEWFYTPVAAYADLTALETLPETTIEVTVDRAPDAHDGTTCAVELKNTGDKLAFFVELQILDEGGQPVLPVLWQDNYVSLLPGEQRSVTVHLPNTASSGPSRLVVAGWNAPPLTIDVER